jgi:hypothetical protein
MSRLLMVVAVIVIATSALAAEEQRKDRARLDTIEQSLKSDVPRVLCLDGSFATGGQPSEQAFAKVAANGFHSVLSLRTPDEGIDLKKERASVEKTGLRYFNIPVVSSAPRTNRPTSSFAWSEKNLITRCLSTAPPPIGLGRS